MSKDTRVSGNFFLIIKYLRENIKLNSSSVRNAPELMRKPYVLMEPLDTGEKKIQHVT